MSIFSRENIKFAKRWLAHPLRMGTFLPLPSKAGRELIKKIPQLSENGYILEIGSGSGSLTKFLYDDEKINKKIICMEIDSELCDVLDQKFPDVKIINANAAKFEKSIDGDLLKNVEVIVSSIPFLSLDRAVTKQIFESCSKVLNNGAVMFHISYTPFIPVKHESYGMKKDFVKTLIGIPMTYLHCYKSI